MFNYFLLFLFFIVHISCSDDDDSRGENGRPSLIKTNQERKGKISFYYQNDRISKIIEEKDATFLFGYEKDQLIYFDSAPTDKDIADGNTTTRFERKGNEIIVTFSNDPSWEFHEEAIIKLGENDIPVKMTYTGLFYPDDLFYDTGKNGLSITGFYESEGIYYSTFTFDPSTGKLIKEEIYGVGSRTEKIFTYTYEYEDSPGIFSRINLPLWFHAYINHTIRNAKTGLEPSIINYVNNISKKDIEYLQGDIVYSIEINYSYQYNKSGFPISMHNDQDNTSTITIKY